MPQMSPINWFTLMLFLIVMMMFMIVLMYYLNLISYNVYLSKKEMKYLNWMW